MFCGRYVAPVIWGVGLDPQPRLDEGVEAARANESRRRTESAGLCRCQDAAPGIGVTEPDEVAIRRRGMAADTLHGCAVEPDVLGLRLHVGRDHDLLRRFVAD